ncbi:hypothetical protein PTKU64_55670 [Paraburkholderia terrae]|uniref:Uncharacterized protein n=1 Tax=Paraburkholderia terrae TaxID=311230 RepID=A0ABN6JLW9_9BURK|nr:hypothetical protein PTKU64_55670 [Paraburkholderia terrae]
MRPSTANSADGLRKFASGPCRRVASLNDRIGSARYKTKTNTNTLDTFKGPARIDD